MKNLGFILLLFLFSCDEKKNAITKQEKAEQEVKVPAENSFITEVTSQPWFRHYKRENPDFKQDFFELKENSPITYNETSLPILNEKGFNEIYKPFLVFSDSGNKYLDFDSYQWFLNADGSASFSPDQQVVVADLKTREAKQIDFFGPSFWIEDSYWKGDSVAVVMGNSYDKVPFIIKYNFDNNSKKYYKYSDTLQFETAFSTVRLRKNGIRPE